MINKKLGGNYTANTLEEVIEGLKAISSLTTEPVYFRVSPTYNWKAWNSGDGEKGWKNWKSPYNNPKSQPAYHWMKEVGKLKEIKDELNKYFNFLAQGIGYDLDFTFSTIGKYDSGAPEYEYQKRCVVVAFKPKKGEQPMSKELLKTLKENFVPKIIDGVKIFLK